MSNAASTEQLSVRLLADVDSVKPASKFQVGLFFRVKPGWHIYWRNPGSAGLPTSVEWQAPPGVALGQIQWPKPQKITEPGVVLYGYTGEVLLPVTVQLATESAQQKRVTLHGMIRWTVCSDICIPGKAELNLTLPRSEQAPMKASNVGLFASALSAMPKAVPATWRTTAKVDGERFALDVITGKAEPPVQFYPYRNDVIDDASDQNFVSTPEGFTLQLIQSQFITRIPDELEGLLITTAGEAYAISAPLSAGSANAVSGPAAGTPAGTSVRVASSTSSTSLGYALWLALLGGVLLNIMPCVLPVLSLKLIHLANANRAELSHTRTHALLYLLGTLAAFWILAGTLMGLRFAGQQIGWGFQMQSPTVVICLAMLMFLVGLNLLGVFEIGGSWFGVGSSLAGRSGAMGAFFTGVLAAVAATPCTAPFMGVAIGYAVTQSPITVALTFSALAIGLAAPFVLLTLWPQWIRLLPRPGMWMIRLRQALSFPMFCTVIWLVWVLARQHGADSAAMLLVGVLLIVLAIWIVTTFKRGVARNVVAAAVGLSALAVPLAFARLVPATQADDASAVRARADTTLVWERYTPEKLQQYRSERRPVFVDFTAAWCVTCLVNERTILRSAEVQRRLMEARVVLLKADWTSYSADITGALKDFGRVGIPFYVLYGRTQTPLLATEALTTDRLGSALNLLAADGDANPSDSPKDN